jgi:lipopolysaccharide/colanic/teichoic acid biosynthesis glycosyltransferase
MRGFSFISATALAVLTCDVLIVGVIYATCVILASGGLIDPFLLDPIEWLRISIAVSSVAIGLYFNDLYKNVRVSSRVALGLQLSHVFGISLVLQTVIAYLDPDVVVSRRVMLFGTLVALPALLGWRILFSSAIWRLVGQQTLLLVGSGQLAQNLVAEIARKPERGIRVAGYVGDPIPEQSMPCSYLGPYSELATLALEYKPDRIVVTSPNHRDANLPISQLLDIRRRGMLIEDGARTFESLAGRVSAADFRPAQYIFDQTMVHRPGSLALQSIYVNVLALCGIVVFSPVLILLAILVRISTGGPVLDCIPCTGYHGLPFDLKRFRTRRIDPATNSLKVTRLGDVLQRTHLNLLPALFNLVRGELALVGPRAHRSEFASELAMRIPFYEQRYAVKPGLTGWSQINMEAGEGPSDALRALEYDLYYLKNLSLSLDAYILLHKLRQLSAFST